MGEIPSTKSLENSHLLGFGRTPTKDLVGWLMWVRGRHFKKVKTTKMEEKKENGILPRNRSSVKTIWGIGPLICIYLDDTPQIASPLDF